MIDRTVVTEPRDLHIHVHTIRYLKFYTCRSPQIKSIYDPSRHNVAEPFRRRRVFMRQSTHGSSLVRTRSGGSTGGAKTASGRTLTILYVSPLTESVVGIMRNYLYIILLSYSNKQPACALLVLFRYESCPAFATCGVYLWWVAVLHRWMDGCVCGEKICF